MIPSKLVTLIEQQPGHIHRGDKLAVISALDRLNIDRRSQLAEFFLTYTITLFKSESSDEELCDIANPSEEIRVGTDFVHEVWELPKNLICLTTVEGEGCYLYDKITERVLDFSLETREDFLSGNPSQSWDSFYEFLVWYLR